ncbi:hypothetical protein Tco_0385138 [Tanacetum coccineum]
MGQMAEGFQESPLGVLPSNTMTDPLAKLNVITSVDGLTLDRSFIPHSNFLVYQEKEQESETITEVVEIASSKSTPIVPPPTTPPLSTPKLKEDLEPNPHQPLIPYPSRLQEENFQALENPTGRVDYFVYRLDIVDSLCDKFPIENNSLSGNPTPSSDSMWQTTTHSDFSLPKYDSFIFDLLIDPFPPTDRSDSHHEEFADELTHILSPPEYDCFYFNIKSDLGELTILCEEKISKDSTKELTSPELNDFPLLLSDCDSTFSKEFSKIDLLVSFPSGNKDKIFDTRIFIIKRVQSKRFHIFPLVDFSTISVISDFLLLTDP